MPCCFVPGCTSGSSSTARKNKSLGLKNPSLFSAPKDDCLREKWQKIINRKDKVLTPTDKICELHFREDCIVRAYVTKVFDGTVSVIERERAALKPGSLPSLYNNSHALLSSELEENHPSPTDRTDLLSGKRSYPFFSDESSETPERNPSSCAVPSETSERNSPSPCIPQMKKEPDIVDDSFHVGENGNDIINEEEEFSYIYLMQHLEQVTKPNLWWTISFCEEYVVCAKWDERCRNEKKVIVFQDLIAKIFVRDIEVSSLSMKVQNLQSLSALLFKIDSVFICKCIELGYCNVCAGYISDDPADHHHRIWCTDCSIHRKRDKDNARNERRRRLYVRKEKDMARMVRNLKKQNKRLRDKVLRLKPRTEKGKSQSTQTDDNISEL